MGWACVVLPSGVRSRITSPPMKAFGAALERRARNFLNLLVPTRPKKYHAARGQSHAVGATFWAFPKPHKRLVGKPKVAPKKGRRSDRDKVDIRRHAMCTSDVLRSAHLRMAYAILRRGKAGRRTAARKARMRRRSIFSPAPPARARNPETSQPLDRERLFQGAPIFHLTGPGECINSWGTVSQRPPA